MEILVPDRVGRTSYIVGSSLVVIMLAMITWLMGKLPSMVPLYFTLPWGEGRLAPKLMLYILPGLAFGFMVINLVIGRFFAKLSPLIPRALGVATAAIAGMIMVGLLGIVQSLIL